MAVITVKCVLNDMGQLEVRARCGQVQWLLVTDQRGVRTWAEAGGPPRHVRRIMRAEARAWSRRRAR